MDNKLPLLRVRMFVKERITYGNEQIIFGRNSITKAMKLLLILLHYGKEGIARNRLLQDLYDREELSNVSNNFRVTLHRLKKMLVDAGLPEYEYIVSKDGYFYWDSPMEIELDTEVFKDKISAAKQSVDAKEKINLLREACQLYNGEFLQKLSGDEWVLMESVRYKNMYTYALEALCSLLMEYREYDEVLKIVEPACEMYPFDEWQSVKIDCYIAMNHYKDALREYESTAKLLIEELGITPSNKMMEQFRIMSEHISSRPQIITEIQGGLQEDNEEKGAFFCTFPGFRDAYRVIRRGMERNGQSVFLMVCTLVDSKGRPLENSDKLDLMSEALYNSIKNSLRRSDSFTRYNPSQYLVMLMGTNKENCQIVIDRVKKNFSKEHKSWSQYLNCTVTSLYDIKKGEEGIHFKRMIP